MNKINKNNICNVCILTSDSETISEICVSKTIRHLKNTEICAITIDINYLTEDIISKFDVLLITGGEPRRIRNSIGGKCANIIRKFISNGGGYIGICAGAVLATRKSPTLDLLPMVKCINDNIWWASGIEGTVLLKRVKNKFLSYQDKKLITTFVPEIKGTPHFYFNGPL